MVKWSEEEKKLLVKHYDSYAARGKTYKLIKHFFPGKTVKQIRSKVNSMRRTSEWVEYW